MIGEKNCTKCKVVMDTAFEIKEDKIIWFYECQNKNCTDYQKRDVISIKIIQEKGDGKCH